MKVYIRLMGLWCGLRSFESCASAASSAEGVLMSTQADVSLSPHCRGLKGISADMAGLQTSVGAIVSRCWEDWMRCKQPRAWRCFRVVHISKQSNSRRRSCDTSRTRWFGPAA